MLDNQASARKAVLVSMVALLGIAYYRSARGEATGSVYRRLWGVGVVGVALSVLADFAPSVAGPFAVLTVLGSLTNGGDKALQQALGTISRGAPATRPASTATATTRQTSGRRPTNTTQGGSQR